MTFFSLISPEVVVIIATIHIEGAPWHHVASSFLQHLPTVELVWRYTPGLRKNINISVDEFEWQEKWADETS